MYAFASSALAERCFYYSPDTNYERDGILVSPSPPPPPAVVYSTHRERFAFPPRLGEDSIDSALEESSYFAYFAVMSPFFTGSLRDGWYEKSGDRRERRRKEDAARSRGIKKQGSRVSINDTKEGLGLSEGRLKVPRALPQDKSRERSRHIAIDTRGYV